MKAISASVFAMTGVGSLHSFPLGHLEMECPREVYTWVKIVASVEEEEVVDTVMCSMVSVDDGVVAEDFPLPLLLGDIS